MMEGYGSIVLSNGVYRRAFGRDNPDLDLIRQLADQGIDLFVSAQSLPGAGHAFRITN